ncbi:O-antigen ligase family protein [Geodermatophilus nigrescens]|uniref:O-antigen ligase n=1 Tax=Geodermatophilus nigrescens TaxID=1070870 RepID=A0A1M5D4G9_9ACTN|nr:O-antigen ligase family protein [Geodermatophilus nigrescens]SHF61735.1 O-antigen ligase [Geodermatophilus nigrescens]
MTFVLAQWSDIPACRWLLRGLPVVVLLVLVSLSPRARARLTMPLPLGSFLLWACASVIWSIDAQNSLRRLTEAVALIAVGWMVGQTLGLAGSRRVLARCVQVLLLASVVTHLVAPAWASAPAGDGAPGWHGPFPHKNAFGFFCALAVVTLYCQMPAGWRRRAWLVLALFLLVMSESASALAATVAAIGVLTWQTMRTERPGPAPRAVADVIALAVLVTMAAVVALRPQGVLEVLGRDSSLTGRREIWIAVIRQIHERPLEGFGFGGVWDPASPVTLEMWREARFQAFYAHSGYLDIPLQVGLTGSVLLGAVLVSAVVRASRSPLHRDSAWAFGVVAVLLVTAITESSPFTGDGLLLIALMASVRGPGISSVMPQKLSGSDARGPSGHHRVAPVVPTPGDPWR